MQENKWDRLVEARKAKCLTQKQLAKVCGVAVSTIVRWESLFFQPNINQLKQISYELDVPIDWLIYNDQFTHGNLEYWNNVSDAKNWISQQFNGPEEDNYLVKNGFIVTEDSIQEWVEDKMNLPHNYFLLDDLLSAMPEKLTNPNSKEEIKNSQDKDKFPMAEFGVIEKLKRK